jgi:thiol-disulfide isomerase/thioredoxin
MPRRQPAFRSRTGVPEIPVRVSTILALAFLALFSAFSVKVKYDLRHRAESTSTLSTWDEAPGFALPALDGTQVDLASVVAGKKVVVLNFWAPWCAPCRLEMPELDRLYRKYKGQGVEFLTITSEPRDTVEEFLSQHEYTLPVLLDSGKVSKEYGIQALPTTFVIGSDRHVHDITMGVATLLDMQVRVALKLDEKVKPDE